MKAKVFPILTVLVILVLVAIPIVSAEAPTLPTLAQSVEEAMRAFALKPVDQFAEAGPFFLVLDKSADAITRFWGSEAKTWKSPGDLYFVSCRQDGLCFAGGWGVLWRSIDAGLTWGPAAGLTDLKDPAGLWAKYGVKVEGGFPDIDFDKDGKTIAVAMSNQDQNKGGVYWSYDSGLTWFSGPEGLSGGPITGLERISGELWAINGVDAYRLDPVTVGEETRGQTWTQVQLGLGSEGWRNVLILDLEAWVCAPRSSNPEGETFVIVPDVLRDEKIYPAAFNRESSKGDVIPLSALDAMLGTDDGIWTPKSLAPDRSKINWSEWRQVALAGLEVRFLGTIEDHYILAATDRGLKWVVQPTQPR